MTWGFVGAGTAIAGAYNAYQSNKAAGAAGDRANALYDQNMQNIQGFNQEQKQLYGPLEQNLVQQASSNQPLYYGQMAGQINAGTNAAERGLDTSLAARGMSGSGVQAGGIQGLEMGKQGTLASAFQTGLQMRTALGQQVLQRYQPMFGQQLQMGATSQAANFNQNQQMLYGNAAAQGWGNVAKGLGTMAQGYLMSPSTPDPTPASPVVGGPNPPGIYTPGVGIPSNPNMGMSPLMTPGDQAGNMQMPYPGGIGPQMLQPGGMSPGGLNMLGPGSLGQFQNIGGSSTTGVR